MKYLQPTSIDIAGPKGVTSKCQHLLAGHYLIILALCLTIAYSAPSFSKQISNKHINEQLLYKDTLLHIRKGQLKQAHKGIDQLQNYPLLPYVEKALHYKQINQLDSRKAHQFLSRYSGSVPAKQFRQRWLKHLAKQQRWPLFLEFYIDDEASTDLRCNHLEALHHTNKINASLINTNKLWLSNKSLPKACDNAFKRWKAAGLQTDDIIWVRSKLAVADNNYSLAKYLGKQSSPNMNGYIKELVNYYRKPHRLNVEKLLDKPSPYTKDIIYAAIQQLADHDIEKTMDQWPLLTQSGAFTPKELQDIKQAIGRNLIASGNKNTLAWLIANDPNGDDQYLFEWRILLALKAKNWSTAERWIKLLPPHEQLKPQWQYWLARSQLKINHQHANAYNTLKALADERHYYGFLAAKQLNKKYSFKQQATPAQAEQQNIEASPSIQRAKIFYNMGEITAARREWHNASLNFTAEQHLQASQIAHQWGWHQQAILSSTKASHKDDLTLRFPLAFKDNILPAAKHTQIKPEWIYAITRQESAFATDAISPIGAKGLMQLRPSTAKELAKQSGIKFHHKDIYQAETNINLGSQYLQNLLQTFNGNRILATAAFNAGPYRVKRWLKRQPQEMDYDIWIETLPYYETRNYIKNVLASSLIYGHRLGKDISLIDNHEEMINYQENK